MAVSCSNRQPMAVPCPAVVSRRIVVLNPAVRLHAVSSDLAIRLIPASIDESMCAPGWKMSAETPSASQRVSSSTIALMLFLRFAASGDARLSR